MTAQNKPYPAVQLLITTFADWLKHRRELNEMRQMNRADFDRIAEDLRVSPGDLNELVRKGPHAADELPVLLKALGIDRHKLARAEPMLMRDMERVCALCRHKPQCDRDLLTGTAAEHYENYCLNAPSIDRVTKTAATWFPLTIGVRTPQMTCNESTPIGRAVLIALLALVLMGPRAATAAATGADSAASGRKLAEAWCKGCHAIEPRTGGTSTAAPDFAAVANMPSTTELALKVFLRTPHPSMPNLVLTPEQTDDIVNYILSLKPNRT